MRNVLHLQSILEIGFLFNLLVFFVHGNCREDAMLCPGTQITIGRDPMKNCTFPMETCPFSRDDLCLCPNNYTSVPKNKESGECNLTLCNETQVTCSTQLHTCPDGSLVRPNAYKNCTFDCPLNSTKPTKCPDDTLLCPDFSIVRRDPSLNCYFPECPPFITCSEDLGQCSDGSYVARDFFNNCALDDCPTGEVLRRCQNDVSKCGKKRVLELDCNFAE